MLQGNYNWAEQVQQQAVPLTQRSMSPVKFVAAVICFLTGTGYATNTVPNLLEVDKVLQVCCLNLSSVF